MSGLLPVVRRNLLLSLSLLGALLEPSLFSAPWATTAALQIAFE